MVEHAFTAGPSRPSVVDVCPDNLLAVTHQQGPIASSRHRYDPQVRAPDGYPVILRESAIDWRDYLDVLLEDGTIEEWSISNGAVLELWFEARWISVRYETMRPSRERRVWLYFDRPDGRDGMELERAAMRLRWPSRR